MADKTRQGWSREQGSILVTVTQQLQKDIDTQMTEVLNLFRELEGEEIIGECEQKDPMLEGIAAMKQTIDTMGEKFADLSKKFDKFAGEFDAAISVNIKNSEDAVSILHKAATDAKEATGAKA